MQLLPISLTAERGNWQMFTSRKRNPRFLEIEKKILDAAVAGATGAVHAAGRRMPVASVPFAVLFRRLEPIGNALNCPDCGLPGGPAEETSSYSSRGPHAWIEKTVGAASG